MGQVVTKGIPEARECLLNARSVLGGQADVPKQSSALCMPAGGGGAQAASEGCYVLRGVLFVVWCQAPSGVSAHKPAILPQDTAAFCLGPRRSCHEASVALDGSTISYLCDF